MSTSRVAREDRRVWLFLLIPMSAIITASAYYLFEHVFYVRPDMNMAGYGVFLAPRFLGVMNDLPSGVFTEWFELLWVLPTLMLVVSFACWLGVERGLSFRRFSWVLYVLTLLVALLFLFLTPHGLLHISMQTQSINNGIWSAFETLRNTPAFNDVGVVAKARYIFQVLGSNQAGYTIPGTTHPPGLFLVMYAILDTAKLISNRLGGDSQTLAATWGVLVTVINALLVPVTMSLAKEAYSEEVGRWTGIFMLTIPSVCIHFAAIGDGIASLFLATAMLFMVYAVKLDFDECSNHALVRSMGCGLGAGLFLTLAAQMTYGHAFPILALVLTFYFVKRRSNLRSLSAVTLGLAIPAVLYFVFEYWISSGTSFWVVRALAITNLVGTGLDVVRPYPLVQVANFVVMSVMGGLLFLPVLIYISFEVIRNAANWWRQATPDMASETAVRRFLFIATFLMLLLLLTQTTVRLEVERTWHWFFIPAWSLMGIFILSTRTVAKRLFPGASEKVLLWVPLVLCGGQLMVTILLAMSIQDYY